MEASSSTTINPIGPLGLELVATQQGLRIESCACVQACARQIWWDENWTAGVRRSCGGQLDGQVCPSKRCVSRHSAHKLVETCIGVPTSTLRGPIATTAAYVAYSRKENPKHVPKLRVRQEPSCHVHTKCGMWHISNLDLENQFVQSSLDLSSGQMELVKKLQIAELPRDSLVELGPMTSPLGERCWMFQVEDLENMNQINKCPCGGVRLSLVNFLVFTTNDLLMVDQRYSSSADIRQNFRVEDTELAVRDPRRKTDDVPDDGDTAESSHQGMR